MKNITLAIDEALLERARLHAAQRGTTVNALVREYLTRVASEDDRIAQARADIRMMAGKSRLEIGERAWSRDDLHER